jgi:hypothetical protein
LGLGRHTEGLALLNRAFERIDRASDPLRVELLLYQYAHDEPHRNVALATLKDALIKGQRSLGWDFDITLKRATKDHHPDLPLLSDLAKVVLGEVDIKTLEKHTAWRAA